LLVQTPILNKQERSCQGPSDRCQGPGDQSQGPGDQSQGPSDRCQGPGDRCQGPGYQSQGPGYQEIAETKKEIKAKDQDIKAKDQEIAQAKAQGKPSEFIAELVQQRQELKEDKQKLEDDKQRIVSDIAYLRKEKENLAQEKQVLIEEKKKLQGNDYLQPRAGDEQLMNLQHLWRALLAGEVTPGGKGPGWMKKDLGNDIQVYTIQQALNEEQGEERKTPIKWLLQGEHLIVRKSTRDLFKELLGLADSPLSGGGAVITGNPGIGKSWFLSYCLLEFSKQKRNIFYESVQSQQWWWFRPPPHGDVVEVRIGQLPNEIWHPSSIYLFDPYGGAPRESLGVPAFTIVTASPNKVHYKEFLKKVMRKCYLPVWSLEELRAVRSYFPWVSDDDLCRRFEKFGGIVRYTLQPKDRTDEITLDNELNNNISNASLTAIFRAVGNLETLQESHMILQYHLHSPGGVLCFHSPRVAFASQYIAETIF